MERDIVRSESYFNRREEIIAAAAQLFHLKGFHGTSIGDIASKVGLPKGGLYYYIENKEELLFVIITRGIRSVLPDLQKINDADLPPEEKLRQAVKANVIMLAKYREFVSVFLREKNSLDSEHLEQYLKDRDAVEGIFYGIIQDGVNKGVFKVTNVKLITFSILGMCNWVTQWYRPDGKASPEEIGGDFAETAYRMVKK